MGCSLNYYWEVFYWEGNNEDASEYNPNKRIIPKVPISERW